MRQKGPCAVQACAYGQFERHFCVNLCELILTLVVVGGHLVLEEFFNVLAFPPVFLGGTLPHEVQGKLSLVVDHHHLCAPLQQQADLKHIRLSLYCGDSAK